MEKFKKLLAITLVLCISVSFIACSNTPQSNEGDEDKTAETRAPASDIPIKNPENEETANNLNETTKVTETTSNIEVSALPTVDLLSSFVEKYISFSGADGFGKLNMSFKGEDGVIASKDSASITCVGNYENYFTVSNGGDSIPAHIDVSKTDALTSGDTITFSISYYEPEKAASLGFSVTPFTVTVPELGKYITNSAQITDDIWQKIINPDNWTGQEGSFERKDAEGALLCYALPAYLYDNGEWKTESRYGIALIIKNGSYSPPYAYIFLTDIKIFSDGKLEAKAVEYNHSSTAYNAYNTLNKKIGEHFDILMGERYDIEVSTLYHIIKPDGRPQVELFSKFAEQFVFAGENGNGILTIPDFSKDGTLLHTEPHKDGDLYFIVDNSYYTDCIRVVQNNKVLARFKWGVNFDSGLNSGDEVYVGMWFIGSNEISDFEDLPFQFVPTKLVAPEFGEVITNINNLPVIDKLISGIGETYESGMSNYIPAGAKIFKIQQLILKPQYTLDSKYKNNWSLLIYYEYEGNYYGVWCFDMMAYSDGGIRPKYYKVIENGSLSTSAKFTSIQALEKKIFDAWNNSIDREKYDITVLYE